MGIYVLPFFIDQYFLRNIKENIKHLFYTKQFY